MATVQSSSRIHTSEVNRSGTVALLFLAFSKGLRAKCRVIKGNTNIIDYAFTGTHNGIHGNVTCMLRCTFG